MDVMTCNLDALFAQLGLPNAEEDIDAFIEKHSPVPDDILLCDASFWTPAQSAFLKQAIKDDADWALVVDELSMLLRSS